MISAHIPDLPGKQHIAVVALDEVVGHPSQIAHCILGLTSSSISLPCHTTMRAVALISHLSNRFAVMNFLQTEAQGMIFIACRYNESAEIGTFSC